MTVRQWDDDVVRDALRRGDIDGLRAAFDRSYTAMALLLRPFADDDADAVDRMIADVWRDSIAARAHVPERGSVRPWLFAFLQPRFDRARDRTEQTHDGGRPEPEGTYVPDGEPWAGHWEAFPTPWEDSLDRWLSSPQGQGVLADALHAAPPQDRLLLVLRDVDGWSAAEVAALTGLLPQAQQTALAWARHRLRLAVDRARPSAAGADSAPGEAVSDGPPDTVPR